MPDYSQLREQCNKVSRISTAVIDDFIVYYAAKRDKLDQEFESRISRFRHAGKGMPSNWSGLIEAQYIGHRIFKQQGLIPKYLNHSAIKDLDAEQQDYLRQMAAHPWRFSFSKIKASPAPDFYEMQDVFTGDTYLLYSASVSQILSERPVLLWFNLIGFNDHCWQTYGPVTGFQSFEEDDIFFYATELDPKIESGDDLVKDLDNNPVPYIMLMTGSVYPLVKHGEFEVLQVTGENHSALFDAKALKKEFKLAYAEGVFKLSHKLWSEPPHFAEAYYEEERGIIFLNALTERGYLEMGACLNAYAFNLPVDPDIRLHLPMLTVIKNLLKKDPELNPYSRLFEIKPSAESDALMKKLNEFMMLALPYINEGKEPDIDALAKKTGVDPKIAREILQKSMGSIKKLRKNDKNNTGLR